MKYIRFGSTGMKVSSLCLGCMTYGSPKWRDWVLDEEASRPFIKQALDFGINFFDTADVYSIGDSEAILGRTLLKMVPRHEIILASKVALPMSDKPNDSGLSRKHILSSIDNSLKRLGTDYLDLYIIHRFDPNTPIEETIDALDNVVRSGKARYIGASSMSAWQFMRMLGLQEKYGLSKFVSMQNHYNLVYREEEREMLPLCREMGIAITPWSPLARGILAGAKQAKTLRSSTDKHSTIWYNLPAQEAAIVNAVRQIAVDKSVPLAQIALAWVRSKAGITCPIIGASKAHHINDAVASLSVKLSEQEIAKLEEHYQPRAVAGHE